VSRKFIIRFSWITLAIAVLVLARVLAAPEGGEGGKEGKGGKGKGGSKLVDVSILVLQPETYTPMVLSSGTLLAREEVDLKSETAGRVTDILFKEGAQVKKGALLVKINDADIRAQLAKVETRIKLASAREVRQRQLLAQGLVSQDEYEAALEEKEGFLADRDLLKAQLDKTEIRAPFAGVVGIRDVSEGGNVAVGQRIAGLFSLDPLKIDFSVPERYYGQVKTGDTLLISMDGRPKPVKGTVYAIEPKVDPATRMLRIRGYCPNPQGRIPPGASARVQVPLAAVRDAIMVPSMAVIPDIKGQSVMLYRGGTAQAVPVQSGYRTEDRLQIEGVAAGDTLIVSGLIRLQTGSPVRLAEVHRGGG
jgi:membrane fusion protein (multidrug efflux system)